MLAASMAVPALVRCCLLASRAWSQQPHSCDGERHDALEMLAFTCHPARDADVPDSAQLMQRVKELVVQEMGITVQSDSALWIASKPMVNRGAAAGREAPTHPGIHFRVLPRIGSEQDLRDLIERIHGNHQLFGGRVLVHAPNSALCLRCTDCDELGHHRQACDQYGGLAVRFLFQTPMPPFALDVMKAKLGATNAYLGNAIGTCTPSRIVTVLFNTSLGVDIAAMTRPLA
jgi:hypothetical protein